VFPARHPVSRQTDVEAAQLPTLKGAFAGRSWRRLSTSVRVNTGRKRRVRSTIAASFIDQMLFADLGRHKFSRERGYVFVLK
jgi:hypothetical protein